MEETKSFMLVPKKHKVFAYLDKKPNANIYELYFTFPKVPKETMKVYKSLYRREQRAFKPEYLKDVKILLYVMNTKMTAVTLMSKAEKDAILRLSEVVKEAIKT